MNRIALRRTLATALCCMVGFSRATVSASDHIDVPAIASDSAADLGDLYAWMSPDGRRLNLVLNIVGRRFSDRIAYVFHIDSGKRVGLTQATATIDCRFDVAGNIRCAGAGDQLAGMPDRIEGVESQEKVFRVFAGLRDDPFANNVRGTRQAYEVAGAALQKGVASDVASCPTFNVETASEILDRWRHTDGGPARDFLIGWKTAALVVSIDVNAVDRGGPLIAVWAGSYKLSEDGSSWAERGVRVDRVGRILIGNALLGPLDKGDLIDARKKSYNEAEQKDWMTFVPYIQRTLGLYDGFDGICGNQLLADASLGSDRYRALAEILADDRLWVDSRNVHCESYMAVERGKSMSAGYCGGRTPIGNANEVFRSLLVHGTESGVSDGIDRDDMPHSTTEFPFLAEP